MDLTDSILSSRCPETCHQQSRKQRLALKEYVDKERAAGHLLGPVPGACVHISRMGVIPKGHVPGRWRVITDLSNPPGASVNDGIDTDLCSLKYVTVDKVAEIVHRLGRGALMAKVDIEAAYRLVPVHSEDRPLLGVQINNECFCDGMLPFGLRSAPKIFTALADALEWCIRRQGVDFVFHYLDDFIILGRPGLSQCGDDLKSLQEVCSTLGVPLAAHKQEGPTTCLTFLGIEIDSVERTLRLPEEKLRRLMVTLHEWGDRTSCTRRELESLAGLLSHACKVVHPGRSFLQRMFDLLSGTEQPGSRPFHYVRLNLEFRSDLAWWRMFLQPWNGVGLIHKAVLSPQFVCTSDASGSWGCGAWYGLEWFQLEWDQVAAPWDITAKELLPIVIASTVWGRRWSGAVVQFYCDNQAVVAVVQSRTSTDSHMMNLLRMLSFFEAHFGLRLQCEHIEGEKNVEADALSRDNLSLFFSLIKQASKVPVHLPSELVHLLLSQDLDWTSPVWMQLFKTSLTKV